MQQSQILYTEGATILDTKYTINRLRVDNNNLRMFQIQTDVPLTLEQVERDIQGHICDKSWSSEKREEQIKEQPLWELVYIHPFHTLTFDVTTNSYIYVIYDL